MLLINDVFSRRDVGSEEISSGVGGDHSDDAVGVGVGGSERRQERNFVLQREEIAA